LSLRHPPALQTLVLFLTRMTTDWPVCRELNEGWQEHGIGQVPRLQALGVQQARQPLRRAFLIAKAASPWGLTAGLLIHDGLHKVPEGFALMAMCPWQHIRDIMVETSRRRVLSFHTPRLA
jgi:hypothetical protein